MTRGATEHLQEQPLGAFGIEQLGSWSDRGSELLKASRAPIDALNVFPVPDGDTGTNLWLTWQAASEALTASNSRAGAATLADAATRWSRAALLGARGNSGVILAQLLRGVATTFVEHSARTGTAVLSPETSAEVLVRGLGHAVELGYAGVARPVEGTILTVAAAAARAARETVSHGLIPTVTAAVDAGGDALLRTPQQLAVLARAGVVDAGGQGLVLVLEALRSAVDPGAPSVLQVLAAYRLDHPLEHLVAAHAASDPGWEEAPGDGAFEVMYLLEAADAAASNLRQQLDAIGNSVVVVGGDGLWNVHVHTDDAGPAIESGVAAGRVFRIKITPLAEDHREPGLHELTAHGAGAPVVSVMTAGAQRSVVAVASGPGSAALFRAGGAQVISGRAGARPTPGGFVAAAGDASEVLLLPNDDDHRSAAEAAADELRARGTQVAVVPTHADVQGLAALAVHDAGRSFTDDVVTMSSAAGATRFGAVTRADREAITSAGICQPGQFLGLVDGDVVVIGDDPHQVAKGVVDRMLFAGGELVTLLCADDPVPGRPLADGVAARLHETRLDVEVVTYDGGQALYPLLIGVE
ncbi:MAG: DAK2 domain-containing protein [Actinomycetes bacterium]